MSEDIMRTERELDMANELVDQLKAENSALKSKLKRAHVIFTEIKDRRHHWIGEKKREACLDFEECNCAEIRAAEALAEIGKENE